MWFDSATDINGLLGILTTIDQLLAEQLLVVYILIKYVKILIKYVKF